jgi:hypothetical protein
MVAAANMPKSYLARSPLIMAWAGYASGCYGLEMYQKPPPEVAEEVGALGSQVTTLGSQL